MVLYDEKIFFLAMLRTGIEVGRGSSTHWVLMTHKESCSSRRSRWKCMGDEDAGMRGANENTCPARNPRISLLPRSAAAATNSTRCSVLIMAHEYARAMHESIAHAPITQIAEHSAISHVPRIFNGHKRSLACFL
jgi:hypothetical protein